MILPVYTQVSKEARIFCADLSEDVFHYPFFNDGVEQCLLKESGFFELTESIARRFDEGKNLRIKGFIFHTSHCGSTLLGRMLDQCSDIRVVSEPEVINGLLLAYTLNECDRKTVLSKLKTVINVYCQSANEGKHVIFKFTSWNIFMADLFRELFPEVKRMYIDRPTGKCVESLVRSNGGMQQWYFHGSDILRKHFVGNQPNPLSFQEYLKILVDNHRSSAEMKLSQLDLKVCYPDFIQKFESHICPHFEIEISQEEREKIIEQTRYDAKSLEPILFTDQN